MFGREAAVKHNLLESESPKYLRTEDSMCKVIRIGKRLQPVTSKARQR